MKLPESEDLRNTTIIEICELVERLVRIIRMQQEIIEQHKDDAIVN